MTQHKHPKTAVAAATSTSKAHPRAAAPTINPSVFDALPDSALLREAQLVPSSKRPHGTPVLPFSAATLWRLTKAGLFPAPIRLSSRVTAWKVGDVRAWLKECAV